MDVTTQQIESLIEHAGDFADTRLELMKMKFTAKTAGIVSAIASSGVVFIVILLFVLLISVAFSLFMGEILGKFYYGFFIMAGVYGIAGMIIFIGRNKWIRKPINNLVIAEILKEPS